MPRRARPKPMTLAGGGGGWGSSSSKKLIFVDLAFRGSPDQCLSCFQAS